MASATLEKPEKRTTRRATYADLEAVPEHLVAEIMGGRLYTHPRPAPKHAVAHLGLATEIADAFDRGRSGPGGWVILAEPELHLDDEVVAPDIAGWRRERLPSLPDTAYFETTPDWVCEVTSPSTEKRDKDIKRAIYARAGVQHYWVLDPRAELLETFHLENGSWTVGPSFVERAEVCADPFEAINFPLEILWPLKTAAEVQKDDE